MAFTKGKKQFVNILEGKECISISDLIKEFKNGIHITGASIIKGKNGDCSAFTFSENPDLFFFGGKVFTDELKKWVDEKGGIQNVNTELTTDIPLMVIKKCKSKSGNTYYDFEM